MGEGTRLRTAQISPDRFAVGIAAIFLVAAIMLASMAFSFVAIAEAGVWTHVPYGMHWLAPIFIDGAILTYTVSLAVFQARGADSRTLRRTRTILWGFTLLSVAVNFAHAGSGWEWDFGTFEAWFGCVIAIAAPVAALTSAEEVVRLAFRPQPTAVDAQGTSEDESLPADTEVGAVDDVAELAAPGAELPQDADDGALRAARAHDAALHEALRLEDDRELVF